MSTEENHDAVLAEFGRIIAQNADWMDGRTFQRLALVAAEGYYSGEEIDQLLRARSERLHKQAR